MNTEFTLWHNPRCTKSRETLQILKDNNKNPIIREYLKDKPSESEIFNILELLKIDTNNKNEVLTIVRQKEKFWNSENIILSELSAKEIIEKLGEFPKGIQRPICIKNNTIAVIGRPPENILPLL
ncbi:TPA: arsenate reductase (glutaredoxin) [Candidatus Gracilibacteria bacterium]|nr:arsenate reductase (glutaredoxin) [Candidatus Peregrinibacteria bacterium]HIQ56684.1 arsenate reductase (glutaredoxin) [Candidatus Gracilibacteria bacterium]HIQ57488.1 arsenate reductase (glutaredoxin) [Candidatus Gracilibacteria bacterium]